MTKTLVAYFSHTGHTRGFAQTIAKEMNGDLFEIETDQFYPLEHDACSLEAHKEQDEDFRPQLTKTVAQMNQYDLVFIGHPIWWYREPMVIRSFYEAYDFTNKILIPFATSGDVDLTNTVADMKKYMPKSHIIEGLRLSTDTVDSSQSVIKQWLEEIQKEVHHESSNNR